MKQKIETLSIPRITDGTKLWHEAESVSAEDALDQIRRDNYALDRLRTALEENSQLSTKTCF